MTLDHEMQRLRESLKQPPAPPVVQLPTVEEIMARVRAEVARRRAPSSGPVDAGPSSGQTVEGQDATPFTLPRWSPAAARLAYRSEYRLEDLLVFSDRDFVDQCYRIVLRRPPDAGGFAHFLDKLRRGELSKVEVLGEIRFSPEGHQRGVHVDGLLLPYTLQRWGRQRPFGRFLRWTQGLFRLGAHQHRLNLQDAAQGRDIQETGQLINQVVSDIEGARRQLDAEAAEQQRQWSGAIGALETRVTALPQRDEFHGLQQGILALRNELAAMEKRRSVDLAALASRHAALHQQLITGLDGVVKTAALEAVSHGLRRVEARAAAAEARADALASELASARTQYAGLRQEWRKALDAQAGEQATALRAQAGEQAAALEVQKHCLAELRTESAALAEGLRDDVSSLRGFLDEQGVAVNARIDNRDAEMRHYVGHQHQGLVVVVDALKDDFENLRRDQSAAAAFERRMLDELQQLGGKVGGLDSQAGEQAAALEAQKHCLAELRTESAALAEGLRDDVSSLRGFFDDQGVAINARIDNWDAVMRHDIGHQHQGLVVVVDALKDDFEHLRRNQSAAAAFERRMQDALQQLGGTAEGLGARVDSIEAAECKRVIEREASSQTLDGLYAAFEDRFRGSRELILGRVAPYLEWVREAGAGTREAPVLDVGCGRGEWLELLRDQQMHGRGIDINRLFVDACHGRGLDVEHADVLEALRNQPEASVGALTSMHLVEHLPFELVIALLDEARRVLRPGGLLLLETPNPENIAVGACQFYIDPTHRNPIPPETLRWLVEARGFHGARIERLTVGRKLAWPGRVADDVPGALTINALSDQFAAAPDYAVLGLRP